MGTVLPSLCLMRIFPGISSIFKQLFEVLPILVDPGTEAGREELKGHHRPPIARYPLAILLRISVPWCRHMMRGGPS